jgi:dipeptidyl aminopeptidase/acylaminoacyl peptidase
MDCFFHPTELFRYLPADDHLHQLTEFATPMRRKANLLQADLHGDSAATGVYRIQYPGAADEVIEGWFLRGAPVPGRAPPASRPLAILIHGGPQGSWKNSWSYRWNPMVFASHGYSVGLFDFHGSTGYGQNFTDSIRGDYGGKPFIDIEKGRQYLLTTFADELDAANVHALGASYGGYMINWLNGHATGYRSLVVHDGIFSLENLFFETEELWFPLHDLYGFPWAPVSDDNPCAPDSCYTKWSPSAASSAWQTPTLIIHGGQDFRIPETHALSAFTALQVRGIESRLLFFPTENHWVLWPPNSMEWHRQVFLWVDSHLP